MKELSLAEQSQAYLNQLEQWVAALPDLPIEKAIVDPARTAIVSVDVINGFCYEGPLASPRVADIVAPIAALFERAWQRQMRYILLTQDTHEPEAVEFANFPPHCVRGTSEAETVDAFKNLPFFDQILTLPKNSISSGLNTGLTAWIAEHPQVDTYIVVGDCTDLCTYQLAMHLRLDANARQLQRRVMVPANCVQTYDISVETAQQIGGLPHPGDLLHAVFLQHMVINGIQVVGKIA